MNFSLELFQYKTSKEGSTVGVTVSHASLLAQCRALTQACGYSEGKALWGDFSGSACGVWHGWHLSDEPCAGPAVEFRMCHRLSSAGQVGISVCPHVFRE